MDLAVREFQDNADMAWQGAGSTRPIQWNGLRYMLTEVRPPPQQPSSPPLSPPSPPPVTWENEWTLFVWAKFLSLSLISPQFEWYR